MKFLIDECLTAALADIAIERGYYDSAHVNHRGMRGRGDPWLTKVAIDNDWTFVTCNSDDFRPRLGSKSKAPCYVGIELHAGLICLNLSGKRDSTIQKRYFEEALQALEELEGVSELINKLVEVSPDPNDPGKINVDISDFPE